jgi:hypothetical protein
MTGFSVEGCTCYSCRAYREEQATKAAPEPQPATPAAEVKEVPTSRVLTREMVLRQDPCSEYRNRFIERFPVSVEVTVELAVSQAEDWEWGWAATSLLSSKAQRKLYPRMRDAENTFDSTMQPYWDLVNAAYNKYHEAFDQAKAEARSKGMNSLQQWDYAEQQAARILEIPNAAVKAVNKVAQKIKSQEIARAWAEQFIQDYDAYAEEHRFDSEYDEDDYDDEGEDNDW